MELHILVMMCLYVAIIFFVHVVESTVLVHFDQAPQARSSHSYATFKYSFENLDGSNACQNSTCTLTCQLDGQAFSPCPARSLTLNNLTVNRDHVFVVNATASNGDQNSTSYSWFIDTIPPTATIISEQNYTSAKRITLDIKFSEACVGLAGFECLNTSSCDLIIDGPARIDQTSLRIIGPATHYKLDVILSMEIEFARVVIAMADDICKDQAGNRFTRTNASSIIIHIDRRPVVVDFWAAVPSYELVINGILRTVLATNKMEDLKFFLEFTAPIMNSTEQVLNALRVNKGSLIPSGSRNQGNRRFAFELNVTSTTQIITVELQSDLLIGRTGSPVSSVAPVTFLYDALKPGVKLSTNSPNVTKEFEFNVIVEFSKPIFGFEASMVKVIGGRISRLKGLSRALYTLSVVAVTHNMGSVIVTIPEGRLNDISGNLNSASNQLEVKHYSTPSPSIALHSFVTAGILATSLATAVLSLSFANLGAIDTLATGSTNLIGSNPSMNLHGMVGHIQVFVLSDWFSANQPVEFSETAKGLRWLIPHQKLPWKNDNVSVWPNHMYRIANNQTYSCLTCARSEDFVPKPGRFHGQNYNISLIKTPYGQALDTKEYFIYFLRGEPLSASDVVKRMENYRGWRDLEMNLFWLGVGVGGLVTLHVVLLLFIKWRIGTVHGILSLTRFEIFLLILMLPCIAQSSAFVIRGGTTGGIITGALLLAIPAAFILSICLFLTISIFCASLAQYKEIRDIDTNESWCTNLWWLFTTRPVDGKWFYREGIPLSFLSRFGILFESQRGPPLYVLIDQKDSNTTQKWNESRVEGTEIPWATRLLGCARTSYIVVDLLRRVGLGIIAGVKSPKSSSQSTIALSITSVQFICLLIIKPYISRGVHIVETVSLLCEIGFFGLTVSMIEPNPMEAHKLGFIMLTLLFVTFVSHIINEWYSLVTSVLRLSHPHKNSLGLGFKVAAKGLVLPFLSRNHWPEPNTVVPLDKEPRRTRRRKGECIDPRSAMSSTVVPVLSPGSPMNANWQQQRSGEGKHAERRSELKKLRALARASFSADSSHVREASSSYS